MKTHTITHPSFLRLLQRIADNIPGTTSGTYNPADPTAFEKGRMEFEYKDNAYCFEYCDCTWGIEITISKLVLRSLDLDVFEGGKIPRWAYHLKELAGFYISRERRYNEKKGHWESYDVIIPRQKGLKGMPGLLARAFKHCLAVDFVSLKEKHFMLMMEQGDEEPYGCPAGYM